MIWLPTLSVVVVSFFCCNRGFLAADKVYLGELQGGYGVFWPVDRKGYYHPPYCKPYYNTLCLKNLCVSCNITAIARAGCLLVNKSRTWHTILECYKVFFIYFLLLCQGTPRDLANTLRFWPCQTMLVFRMLWRRSSCILHIPVQLHSSKRQRKRLNFQWVLL